VARPPLEPATKLTNTSIEQFLITVGMTRSTDFELDLNNVDNVGDGHCYSVDKAQDSATVTSNGSWAQPAHGDDRGSHLSKQRHSARRGRTTNRVAIGPGDNRRTQSATQRTEG
jgi:hypothetical protein